MSILDKILMNYPKKGKEYHSRPPDSIHIEIYSHDATEDERVEFYKKISYKEFKEVLEELIEKTKREIHAYLDLLLKDDNLVSVGYSEADAEIRKLIDEKIVKKLKESLDELSDLIAIKKISEERPDEYEYYIDSNGKLHIVYVGKKLKKLLEENTSFRYI